MIRVEIVRNQDRLIQSFRMHGHAEFAKPGKDIVCAGASAVSVGTINAIEQLLGIDLKPQMDKGLLTFETPTELEEDKRKQLSLLLDAMIVMLRSIEESYGRYIKLTEQTIN